MAGDYINLSDVPANINKKTLFIERKLIQHNWYRKNKSDFKLIPGTPLGFWLSESEINIFVNSKSLAEIGDGKQGLATADNSQFLRFWYEIEINRTKFDAESLNETCSIDFKWYPYNKAGDKRKWYGNQDYLINWENNGIEIRNFRNSNGKIRSAVRNPNYYFRESISWGLITSAGTSFRQYPNGFIYDVAGMSYFPNNNINKFVLLASLNSKLISKFNKVLNPTINLQIGDVIRLPFLDVDKSSIESYSINSIEISKSEWNSRETSWDFQQNELIRIQGQDLEEAYDSYCQYWQNKLFELHKNEEELNRQFIDIYGLQDELTPDVPLKDITILKEETTIKKGALVFRESEIMAQFISYAVGCMFGRNSLDKPGLILANQGETLETYLENLKASNSKFKTLEDLTFIPDDDNVIPVLDNEWFEDDIVNRFYAFLKATFGKPNFDKNLAFVEDAVGDIRKYFLKTFYTDHVKRYKKRPIYWLFSSPSGAFNALIYMHRYTPDTLNTMLNGYLKEYREKLQAQNTQLDHVKNVGTDREKVTAEKEQARINKVLIELQEYDRELFKIATERIAIDLDDGVLVNYNKFGNVIKSVSGLNDKKAKDKVKKFDWIDVSSIQ